MKKIVPITAIIILILISLCNAQEPISIRSHSLARIIDGDWDLIYDPIDLRYFNDTYFFTNLADFNSSGNLEYGNWEEQNTPFLKELPFGVSFVNPLTKKLKHAFLLRLRNSKEPENANGGSGEFEFKSTNYLDTNEDGLYDKKLIESGKYENYHISKKEAFIFNNNLVLGDNTFGLKFTYDKNKIEDDEAVTDMGEWDFGGLLNGVEAGDCSFDESTTDTLLQDGYTDYEFSEKGDFSYLSKNSMMKFNIAFMRKLEIMGLKPQFRFDYINQQLSNQTFDYEGDYSGSYRKLGEPNIQGNQLEEIGNITDEYSLYRKEENGAENKIELSVKNVFDKRKYCKNNGYWKIGLMYGKYSADYKDKSKTNLNYDQAENHPDNPESNLKKIVSEHQITTDIGDLEGSDTQLYGKFNIPLKETINFGIGFIYDYDITTLKTDYVEENYDSTYYKVGENFDTHNDYINIQSGKFMADRKSETEIFEYNVPVGLEFRLPKEDLSSNDGFGLRNFSFRIGTVFISTKTVINDKKQVTNSLPYTTETEYGDDEVNIDVDDNYYESTSEHSEEIVGQKRFCAGIGYHHSENLDINIGGSIDDEGEDYFLGISFVVKM